MDRQLRGVSVPFLGTTNQVYCDLRQKPSAKSDFSQVRLDAFGRNNGSPTSPPPKKNASIPFLGTT